MARIGVRTVESAKAVPGRDVFVWDDELKGFGVRVKPSGAKSYVLQYRNAYRRSRRITLADCAKLAPEKARKRALKLLGGIAEGADPAEDRKNALAACTVAEFAERYYAEHCLKTKKRSTHASDRSILSKHVLPAIGHKPLNQVDNLDVLKIRGALADKPIVFNRVRTFLSAMFNTAEAWGLRPEGSNPACGVKKHREERRERFLSPRAIVRLGEALAELEREGTIRPAAAAFVRLALTTGMRSSEVRGLRWEDIRPDQNAILLRDSKTGARALPLTPAVAEILGAIPRDSGGPWVIAGRIRGEPMVNPARPWAALCKRAAAISERKAREAADAETRAAEELVGTEFAGLRIHDLRHCHASLAIQRGYGLAIVQKLLGHSTPAMTARYAHLADTFVHQASADVAGEALALLRGRIGGQGDVVPLRQGRG